MNMKRMILSLAILIAATASVFASGDNTKVNDSCKNSKECTLSKKGNGEMRKNRKECSALEGLNLTQEQKTKLADLRKECMPSKKKGCDGKACNDCAACKDCKDGKSCKECKDCKAGNGVCKNIKRDNLSREEKMKLKEERRARIVETRKKYLEGVKNILTPEQYDKFLENSYLSKASNHKNFKSKGHAKRYGKTHDKKRGRKNAA
ncbi:MAG: Spy/CpxP family protein refolding chaperone [Muribaculaceae bacterium]